MRPALEVGDIVLFDKRKPVVEPGAIVVFHDCIHRAVWVEPRVAVWEIGDANARLPLRRAWSEVEGVGFALLREGEWSTLRPARGRDVARLLTRALARREWARIRRIIAGRRAG